MVSEHNLDFTKYNWVDAEVLGRRYFFENNSAGLNWLRDMWNILMFDTAVTEENIAKANLPIEDKAEIVTWILACYDLYCDYEVIVGKRTYYEKSNGEITDYQKDIIKSLRDKELLWAITTNYLKREFIYLNVVSSTYPGHYSSYKDKEIKEKLKLTDFVTTHFTTNADVLTGVYVNQAIFGQILKKRNILIDKIIKHFNSDIENITQFLTGHRWRNVYTNYHELVADLFRKKEEMANKETFEEQISILLDPIMEDDHQQLDIFKVTNDDFFEDKLQKLKENYQVSIEDLEGIEDKPVKSFLPSLKEWINQKMPHLNNL